MKKKKKKRLCTDVRNNINICMILVLINNDVKGEYPFFSRPIVDKVRIRPGQWGRLGSVLCISISTLMLLTG